MFERLGDTLLQARRAGLSRGATRLVIARLQIERVPGNCSPLDLLNMAHVLFLLGDDIQGSLRVRARPFFPGLSTGPGCVDHGWRLISACRLIDPRNDECIGTAFTTLIGGRLPEVQVGPYTAPVPSTWSDEYLLGPQTQNRTSVVNHFYPPR